jgi:hypothetical protein
MPSHLLCALILAQAPAPDAGLHVQTVAIFDLKAAAGTAPRVANALLDVVSEEVAHAPGLKVLSRKDVEAILTEEARKQLTGCDSNSCLSELAGALNAELLVTGELTRLGEGHLLTLQLINHRYANVMNRVSLNWQGPEDQLPDVAAAASQLLTVPHEARKPGHLTVHGAPLGAQLFVDEKPVASFKSTPLDVGVHAARISASGYEDHVVPFVVRGGQAVRLNGALKAVSVWRKPWFIGVTVAAIGAVSVVTAVLVAGIPLAIVLFRFGGAGVSTKATPPGVGGH